MANNRFLETANKWKNDEIPILRESSKGNNLENVLIFSSNKEIYALESHGYMKKIGERDKPVEMFCLNNGKIYDSSGSSIFETLENKEVASRENKVNALCSYNNILHDAEGYNINETLKDKKLVEVKNNLINERYSITSLCPHEKELYFSSGNKVFALGKDEEIARRNGNVWSLIVHNGILCDAASGAICNTLTNKVLVNGRDIARMYSYNGELYYIESDAKIFVSGIKKGEMVQMAAPLIRKKEIAQRKSAIFGFCLHNGELYDFGRYTPLMNTQTGEVIVNKEGIYAAESYPRKLFVDAGVLN